MLKCDVIYKPCQLYVCLVYKPCKLYYKDVLQILQYYKYYKPCKLDYKDVLIKDVLILVPAPQQVT